MKPMRIWIMMLLVCGLLAGCTPAPDAAQDAAPATARPASVAPVAQPVEPGGMPALQVTTLAGAPFDLAGQRGKWVIVNYWATWCGPCLEEMPELSALAAMRRYIVVVGLAYDETSAEELRVFLQTRPVAYPVARIDVYDPPADFGSPRGLPTTWLIRPDGRLARKYTGPVTARMLEEDIADFGGPAPGAGAGPQG